MAIPDPTDPRLVAGEVDFYCAGCGYNLRGLAGDPKRCPECGHLNPIELLILPAEAICQAMRRLETAPTAAFASLLLLAGAVLLLQVACSASAVLGIAGAISMLAGVSAFAHECRYRAGWLGALLRYFVYATLMLVAGFGLPFGLLWAGSIVDRMPWGRPPSGAWFVIVPMLAIPAIAAVHVLYRAAQRTIRELQRETAIQMAREAHQRAVARRMRS